MIFDRTANLGKYNIFSKRVLSQLTGFLNGGSFPAGDTAIDGRLIYASVSEYMTKDYETARPESHRDYADIQLVLSGSESIYLFGADRVEVEKPYVPDIVFYRRPAQPEARLDFAAGNANFVFFAPGEIHMPCISPDGAAPVRVKKLVVKIHRSLLEPVEK